MDLRRINILEKGLYRPKTINQENESCMQGICLVWLKLKLSDEEKWLLLWNRFVEGF